MPPRQLTTLETIRRNLSIITAVSVVLMGVGANRVEMRDVHEQIETIQGLKPEAVAAAVSQSQQDIRDMKQTVERIDRNTSGTAGEVKGIGQRMDEFNSRLEALDNKVNK